MTIKVTDQSQPLVPLYTRTRLGVLFLKWVTPEEAEQAWFRDRMTQRYGKNWEHTND